MLLSIQPIYSTETHQLKEGGISQIEMLTIKKTNLSDIVVFGSTCTIHLHTDNKSLGVRKTAAIIIEKNNEMKGSPRIPAEGTRHRGDPARQKH